jgi:hypothetical protein
MRTRSIGWVLVLLLAAAAAVPALALANAAATTGDATSVTASSVRLNGVIDRPTLTRSGRFSTARRLISVPE